MYKLFMTNWANIWSDQNLIGQWLQATAQKPPAVVMSSNLPCNLSLYQWLPKRIHVRIVYRIAGYQSVIDIMIVAKSNETEQLRLGNCDIGLGSMAYQRDMT